MSYERPLWRTVLSIFFAIFMVIRLLYTCSNSNNTNDNNKFNTNQDIERLVKNQEEFKENLKREYIEQFYLDYKQIEGLSNEEKLQKGIIKLQKDSLIDYTIDTKFNIKKGFFIQNTHNDSLRMSIKSPDELIILMHDYESNESSEKNLRAIKKNYNLKSYKNEKILKLKTISYNITKNGIRFNGYAFDFGLNDYKLFLEFESSKLSKENLRIKALTYFAENFKFPKK